MAQPNTLDELKTAVNKLTSAVQKEILEATGDDKNTKKEERAEKVIEAILETSSHTFTSKLGKDLLADVSKEAQVEKENDLRDYINKKSLERILGELSDATLAAIITKFGLDETKNKTEMEKQILDETFLNGAKSFFSKLKVSILRGIASDLKVAARKGASKEEIVESLMKEIFNLKDDDEAGDDKSNKSSKSSKSSKSKSSGRGKKRSRSRSGSRSRSRSSSPGKRSSSKGSKKTSASPKKAKTSRSKSPKTNVRGGPRPPTSEIKKGDSYIKLFDTYNASDLVSYCKDHKLPTSGAKKVVIKRVLDYLETGTVPSPKDKSKKRRHGGSYPLKPKKKKAGTKDGDKKEKKKDDKAEPKAKRQKKDDSSKSKSS